MVLQAAPTQIPSSVEACPRNKQHVYPVPCALGNDKKPWKSKAGPLKIIRNRWKSKAWTFENNWNPWKSKASLCKQIEILGNPYGNQQKSLKIQGRGPWKSTEVRENSRPGPLEMHTYPENPRPGPSEITRNPWKSKAGALENKQKSLKTQGRGPWKCTEILKIQRRGL